MANPQLRTPWHRLSPRRRQALAALPRSLAILLENVLAHEEEVESFVALFEAWLRDGTSAAELPFRPSRILLQDTAGVAALADLAALRDHYAACGRAPEEIDATIPIDLVIDHSVRVDHSGTADALARNLAEEYARNQERYSFFKWAEQAFASLSVVPPGQGICHQINLERLAQIARPVAGHPHWIGAETVIGTDSHTTMVNALGVLGWGVGGIEAEMAALGQPLAIPLPEVCEVRLTGRPRPGVTATDIALHVTARLRKAGVVDRIVEFDGDALDHLSLPDRAAIANMCPEYGATAGLFPVDAATLAYLDAMGRAPEVLARARAYAEATGLWRSGGPPRRYTTSLVIALDEMVPVMSGPRRPEQVQPLTDIPRTLEESFPDLAPIASADTCSDGAIAIAAITSCTNTANPQLMLAAALLARNAVASGLTVPRWVKTSLAPGSRHIARLLDASGLQPSLDALGFQLVGFGCTTCVGNSGALRPEAEAAVRDGRMLAAVLSGNRNFEARIHPSLKANYLASPPLVVAAALAGNLRVDLTKAPLGRDASGAPVHLADLWPTPEEVAAVLADAERRLHETPCETLAEPSWDALPCASGPRFAWDPASTFICRPPFFDEETRPSATIARARPLLVLGDNVTTDHISPIGRIQPGSPAAQLLFEQGTPVQRLGSYGDRRANHAVMVRGTFDHPRLQNGLAAMAGNRALGPDGRETSVFEAAQAFAAQGTPLVIVAGENYGTGSARDWAAKGTALLGVRAVIARSFERIHRNNLIAMGVLPILLPRDRPLPPVTPETRIAIEAHAPGELRVVFAEPDGRTTILACRPALATPSQADLLRAGGVFALLRSAALAPAQRPVAGH